MPCSCCSSPPPTYSTCPDMCAYGVRATVENLDGSFTTVDSSDYKCCQNTLPSAFQWTYNGTPLYSTHFGTCGVGGYPTGEPNPRLFWHAFTDKDIAANSAFTIHGIPKTFTSTKGYTFNRVISHRLYVGNALGFNDDYVECDASGYIFGTQPPLYGGVDIGYCSSFDFTFSEAMSNCANSITAYPALAFEEIQEAANVVGMASSSAREDCTQFNYFSLCPNEEPRLRVRHEMRWASFEIRCVNDADSYLGESEPPVKCNDCASKVRARWLVSATLYFKVKEFLGCDVNAGVPIDGCPVRACAKKYRICNKLYLMQDCGGSDRIKEPGNPLHRFCGTVGAGKEPGNLEFGTYPGSCSVYPTFHLIGDGASSDIHIDVEMDTGGIRLFADNAANATTAFSWDHVEYDQGGYDYEGDCTETEFWDDKTWKFRLKRAGECCCRCLETENGTVCAGAIGSRCSSGGFCEPGGVCINGACEPEFP